MAYQTGTVATPTALQTVIETFALAQGYTLNAGSGSWLTKDNSHVRVGYSTLPLSSLSRSGTTATATYSNNSIKANDVVTIAGASDALYNGTFTVVSATSTTFTYTMTGTPGANTNSVTYTIVTSYEQLRLMGANSSDGATEPCPSEQGIWIPQANWPVTYYLFYSPTPNQLTCVLQYDTDRIQVIMFGEIVKIHSSAYVGGNWFFASRHINNNAYPGLSGITDTAIAVNYGGCGGVFPFYNSSAVNNFGDFGQVHCKIDTRIWPWSTIMTNNIVLTDYSHAAINRSPNSWNNQAHLVPMHLQFPMASSLYGYIGYVEHLRLIRIDNYEIGDIITLGSDTWKVFPWVRKDSVNRDGSGGGSQTVPWHSGTLGFACRYVP